MDRDLPSHTNHSNLTQTSQHVSEHETTARVMSRRRSLRIPSATTLLGEQFCVCRRSQTHMDQLFCAKTQKWLSNANALPRRWHFSTTGENSSRRDFWYKPRPDRYTAGHGVYRSGPHLQVRRRFKIGVCCTFGNGCVLRTRATRGVVKSWEQPRDHSS